MRKRIYQDQPGVDWNAGIARIDMDKQNQRIALAVIDGWEITDANALEGIDPRFVELCKLHDVPISEQNARAAIPPFTAGKARP